MSCGDAMSLDFRSASDLDCKQFGIDVKSGCIAESRMEEPLSEIKKIKGLQNEQEAITIIKNLSIAAYYVPTERTDFQSIYNQTLLHIAKFISTEGNPNFKILYALYKSQVKDDESKFKETACSEIIENMIGRFDSLVNGDVSSATHLKENFYKLLKEDSRFSIYYIG